MIIKTIHPQNVLFYDDETPPIPLLPLTALCGPNGAGKTNLLNIIAAPGNPRLWANLGRSDAGGSPAVLPTPCKTRWPYPSAPPLSWPSGRGNSCAKFIPTLTTPDPTKPADILSE